LPVYILFLFFLSVFCFSTYDYADIRNRSSSLTLNKLYYFFFQIHSESLCAYIANNFFFINKLYYFIRTFHWCDDSVLLISHRDYYVDFCSDRFFWFLNKTCEMKDDWCELNQNLVPEIKFNEIKKFWQIQK
jgi:hypothetical protein